MEVNEGDCITGRRVIHMLQRMYAPTSHIDFAFVAAGEDALSDLSVALRSLHNSLSNARAATDKEPNIWIVDNGSTRDLSHLYDEYPSIHILSSGRNLGYGSGINLVHSTLHRESLSDSGDKWIIACNTDLEFSADSCAEMLHAIERAPTDTAVIAPMLLNSEEEGGGTQPSIGTFPTLTTLLTGRLRPRMTRKYIPTPLTPTYVDWATGSCLALRMKAFDEVGGFDSEIFLDYEETDLCCRLAHRGWKTRIEPTWRVIHKSPNAHRPANPQRQIHTRQSMVRYLAKHRPAWELRTMGALLRATVVVRSRNSPFAPSWRAGLKTYEELIDHRRNPNEGDAAIANEG